MAYLWCPGLDDEMTQVANSVVQSGLVQGPARTRGGDLSGFSPHDKIYILCHGHCRMPLFTTESGSWTADQLARQLRTDGFVLDQREVELLICHAGESVNTRSNAARLMRVRNKARQALHQNNESRVARLRARFEKISQVGQQPQFYEAHAHPERLLIPMAAQLSQALKNLHYTNFQITSYKCPVAQYFPDANVYLDLTTKGGAFGVAADDHPEYKVIWR